MQVDKVEMKNAPPHDWIKKSGVTNFDIVISAHHGTHFHNELLKINSDIVLASVGYKLKRYFKPEYRFVGNRFLNTFDLGDIVLKKRFVLI